MKLISCYIENFGGLSRYAQDFEEGLTVIQAPNGFGKTTLAEFIRAMFYGFPKKNPNKMGRRQKYAPWNGGKCGGHLTFEFEGTRYRIERTFGERPQQDTFRLTDLRTGKLSKRFTKEIGRELFGLDADSFERSTYLPQSRENGPLTTDSIRAKLGNLVEDTADVGNYEKAVSALRASRSQFIPYRGSGGAVAEATARITRLQRELDGALESSRTLPQTRDCLAQLERAQSDTAERIEATRTAIADARRAESILAHHQRRDQLAAELAGANAAVQAVTEKYPQGLPGRTDLEGISDAVEQEARLAARTVVTDEDQRARCFTQAHQDRFAGGIPAAAEFDEMYRCRDHRHDLEIRINACVLPQSDAAELEGLERLFAAGIPDGAELDRQEEIQARLDGLRAQNRNLAARTAAAPRYKVPSPLTVPLLLGCGAVAALIGMFLLMREMTAPGGVMLGVGLLALVAAAVLRQRTAATCQVETFDPQLRQMIRDNEQQIAELEKTLHAFTASYGGATPAILRQKLGRLTDLRSREEELARQRTALTQAWDADDAALRAFFARYGCEDGDAHAVLNRLRMQCDAWERARKQLADLRDREAQHRRELEQVRRSMEEFRERYGLLPRCREEILAIRDDVRTLREQTAAARELKAQLEAYCRDHADALAAAVPEARVDPIDLERQEKALQLRQNTDAGELLRLKEQLRGQQEDADRVPELQDALDRWQRRKTDCQQRAALLDDTVAFLQEAKDQLATAYMGPIQRSFAALMARMTGEDAAKIIVTPELEVRLERAGASRELAYFSAGQTDLVMLCMRLALVDALFREARPFVILDDPFVNLDDAMTRQALALLRELSRDRQIVYLVCNSSRV